MSSSNTTTGDGTQTETSPLLRPFKIARDHGSVENGQINEDPQDIDGEVPPAEEPSTTVLLKVMSSIWLGTFLAALDSTLTATLSAPISTSFHSLSLFSWLASAYFIANAALQPLSGRLTDILSRRTGLIFSNVFFAIGNLICGLATEEWMMIVGRVVAGMGGGGLNAISTFVASDLVPLRKRGVWQGFGNVCYGVGAGVGGVFGGWVNDVWGWRTAFLVQVPLTILSGLMVFFNVNIPVKESKEHFWKRIDVLGAFTLIATLVLLLIGLNSGGNVVPWSHPLILITLLLSALCFALFIYIETKHPEPIIPVVLLLDRTVLSACLTNWFTSMCVFSIIFYGPIFFQVLGMSTTQAGVRLAPQALGTACGSIGTGLIMRWSGRYWWLSVLIQSIFILSLAIVSTFNLHTPAWLPFIALFLTGLGYSGMLTVTLIALISSVEHKEQAVITSASYAFRSTGSTIGITISGAVFQNILKMQLWNRFGDRKGAAQVIGRIRDNLDEIVRLPPGWKDGVVDGYMAALRGVFLTTLGIAILAGAVSLLMREHTLHNNLARK